METGSAGKHRGFYFWMSIILIVSLSIPIFITHVRGDSSMPVRDFILDDDAAVYEGSWERNATDNPVDRYGGGFRYGWGGAGTKSTYSVTVEVDGWYQVYGWWCVHPNRATDTPYTISCGNQSGTVRVNQEINGGKWNRLYTVKASAGDTITIAISADADEYVISDAVRIALEDGIILDDTDAVYSGPWYGQTDNDAERFGESFHYGDPAGGEEATGTATYTSSVETAGIYKVYGWWTTHENRATDTPYTITSGGVSQTVRVNQETDGGRWNLLCKIQAGAGDSITIVVSNNANQYVIANAVKIVLDDGIIDDNEAIYTGESWVTEANDRMEERYGGAFRYTPWVGEESEPSATAVYSAPVIADGSYTVYGWWTSHENRSTNTPYTISFGDHSETVRVNQQEMGGRWNPLGTVTVSAGDTITVTIGNNANGYVIADAIKIQPEEPEPSLFDELKLMLQTLTLPELESCSDPAVIAEYHSALDAAETLSEGTNPGNEAVRLVMDRLLAAIQAVKDHQQVFYSITVEKDGRGQVTGNIGEIQSGTEATLTAIPEDGWSFTGWYVGDEKVHSAVQYIFIVNSPMTIKALFEENPAPPDKSELEELIRIAEEMKTGDTYKKAVPYAQQKFDKVLMEAKSVLDNGTATPESIADTCTLLQNAVAGLDARCAQKERLDEMIAYAMGLDVSRYNTPGISGFQSALAEAERVSKNPDAVQKDVDEALEQLVSSTVLLRLKGDKSNLS